MSSCIEQTDTVVFALHKALPFSEPLHADAQDYCWGLLCLELFIQLQTRQRAHSFGIQHKALRHNIYANLDESVYFHLSAFSQSLNLHLADGAHIEVIHRWTASKSTSTRQNLIT